MTVQTTGKTQLAHQLAHRTRVLADDRQWIADRIADIQARVPSCGNSPIHPRTQEA